jgi:hypothetical protein
VKNIELIIGPRKCYIDELTTGEKKVLIRILLDSLLDKNKPDIKKFGYIDALKTLINGL